MKIVITFVFALVIAIKAWAGNLNQSTNVTTLSSLSNKLTSLNSQPQISVDECKEFVGLTEEKTKIEILEASKALNYPAGFVVTDFGDCKEHLLVFPSNYSKLPLVSGFSAIGDKRGTFTVTKLENGLGNVRDYADITMADGTENIVLVETGLELGKDWKTWPHGRIWIAKKIGEKVNLSPMFVPKAFYHSVATGDINGDGLHDIVVQHMGTRDASIKNEKGVLFFQQTKNGIFKKRNWLKGNFAGGSSVALIDLDGDGKPELLQGNYKRKTNFFKSAVRIFKWKGDSFSLTTELPRGGIMESKAGINKILPIDIDNDGDEDVLLQLEGRKKGLQIHENLGNFKFQDITGSALGDLEINRKLFQWREAIVADVDNDGNQDIVLQGWSGEQFSNDFGYDIGAGIYFNKGNKSFVRQIGNKKFWVKIPPFSQYFVRYAKRGKQNWLYWMGQDGIVTITRFDVKATY